MRHASIDWLSPVNRLSEFNRGLIAWYLAVPGVTGHSVVRSLLDRANGPTATMTNMDPPTDWVPDRNRPGGFGVAWDLDGTNDYLDVSQESLFDFLSGDFSMACWFNSRVAQVNFTGLISKGSGSTATDAWSMQFDVTGTKPGCNYASDNLTYYTAGGDVAIETNTWNWCLYEFHGSTLRFYLNGLLSPTTGTFAGNRTTNNLNPRIGQQAAGQTPDRVFNGLIDDVRIWNRAWGSERAVRALYEESKAGYHETLRRVPAVSRIFVAAAPQAVGLALEADSALGVTARRTYTVGLPTSAETALGVAGLKLRTVGLAVEADTALPVAAGGAVLVGLAASTETGLAVSRLKARSVGLASSAEAGLGVGRLKTRATGLALSAELGLAVGSAKLRTVGLPTSAELALPVTPRRTLALEIAISAESALAVGRAKLRAVGLATSAETALSVSTSGLAITDPAFDYEGGERYAFEGGRRFTYEAPR